MTSRVGSRSYAALAATLVAAALVGVGVGVGVGGCGTPCVGVVEAYQLLSPGVAKLTVRRDAGGRCYVTDAPGKLLGCRVNERFPACAGG